jgi:hypothetical protein
VTRLRGKGGEEDVKFEEVSFGIIRGVKGGGKSRVWGFSDEGSEAFSDFLRWRTTGSNLSSGEDSGAC